MANERRVIAPDINPVDSYPSVVERELNDAFPVETGRAPLKTNSTANLGDNVDDRMTDVVDSKGGQKDMKTAIIETYSEAVKAAPDVAKSMADAAKSMADNDMEMHGNIGGTDIEIDGTQAEQVNVAAVNGHGVVGVKNATIGKIKANIGIMSFTTNKGYDASKTSYNMANNIAAKKPALFGKKERVGIEGMSSEELEANRAADVEDVMSK